MLHNIPEVIATAFPLCKIGVCKWTSFRVALFSGLAEPIGAMVAVMFLNAFQALISGALAFAGGVWNKSGQISYHQCTRESFGDSFL